MLYWWFAKIKVTVLQQTQDMEVPQIKDLKLVIPEHGAFMASYDFFIALGIPSNCLENATCNKFLLHVGMALSRTR